MEILSYNMIQRVFRIHDIYHAIYYEIPSKAVVLVLHFKQKKTLNIYRNVYLEGILGNTLNPPPLKKIHFNI